MGCAKTYEKGPGVKLMVWGCFWVSPSWASGEIRPALKLKIEITTTSPDTGSVEALEEEERKPEAATLSPLNTAIYVGMIGSTSQHHEVENNPNHTSECNPVIRNSDASRYFATQSRRCSYMLTYLGILIGVLCNGLYPFSENTKICSVGTHIHWGSHPSNFAHRARWGGRISLVCHFYGFSILFDFHVHLHIPKGWRTINETSTTTTTQIHKVHGSRPTKVDRETTEQTSSKNKLLRKEAAPPRQCFFSMSSIALGFRVRLLSGHWSCSGILPAYYSIFLFRVKCLFTSYIFFSRMYFYKIIYNFIVDVRISKEFIFKHVFVQIWTVY